MTMISTSRYTLRTAALVDAQALAEAFDNASFEEVETLISKMRAGVSAEGRAGEMMWSIMYREDIIGCVIARNLGKKPVFKLFINKNMPTDAAKGLGEEVISAVVAHLSPRRDDVEEPMRHSIDDVLNGNVCSLFVGGEYCMSISQLKSVMLSAFAKPKRDKWNRIMEELLSALRDSCLLQWLQYLGECGDGSAFDLREILGALPVDAGDHLVQNRLAKVLAGINIESNDISSNIKLLPDAEVETPDGAFDADIYQPVHLAQVYPGISITLNFEVVQKCHDSILVSIGTECKSISLASKKKRIPVRFSVELSGAPHDCVRVCIDEIPYHSINFQSYPPQDWDEDRCLRTGVYCLYNQQYAKARLCFERYETEASLFWLGIMEYVSTNAEATFELFKEAAGVGNAGWAIAADAMRALMCLKGEGGSPDSQCANAIISGYASSEDAILLLRDAINGKLPSSAFDKYVYAFNIKDRIVTPEHFVEFKDKSLPPVFIIDTRCPFDIVVTDSLIGGRIKYPDDNLYAYIGVTTKNGEWQYVDKEEWADNSDRNRFEYDEADGLWRLHIDDLYKRNGILDFDRVLQLNIILRNNCIDEKIEIKPSDNSYFIVDCLTEPRHVALCNITPLLSKFRSVADLLEQIRIVSKTIQDI